MKEFMEIYSKYKKIFWPVLSFVASVVVISMVIIPQVTEFLSVRGQLESAKDRGAALEAKAAELEQVNEVDIQNKLETAFTVLPTNQDVPEVAGILAQAISKSGLVLKSTSYASSKLSSSKDNFQLNITVLGHINSVRAFLIYLQDLPRLFDVGTIQAKFLGKGGLIETNISLSVYYMPQKTKGVPLDQPLAKLNDQDEELLNLLEKSITQNTPVATSSGEFVPLGKTDPFQ